MCTVTYVPLKENCLITSNRDEKNSRLNAVHPAVYTTAGGKLIYPKDGNAGGTWIALHENGNAAVLLNGGFQPHVPLSKYRASRGKIFLQLFSAIKPFDLFQTIGLQEIEPFTVVLLQRDKLFECRWDGNSKFHQLLDRDRPYIWSSVTLYDAETIQRRQQWFASFIREKPIPAHEDIISFHQFAGDGNPANDLVMKRGTVYSTVSITSILLTGETGTMKYVDMRSKQVSELQTGLTREVEVV